MKEKDAKDRSAEITTPEYAGPDRREAHADTGATVTSVRLRFDPDGSAVWEAASDEPQRRADDDTVRFLEALNEEAADDEYEDDDAGDTTIGHRTLMAFEADDE